MKVLLVVPKTKIWNTPTQIPLGVAYLAAVLLRDGFGVEVYDAGVERRPLGAVLARGRFKLVGISVTTASVMNGWRIARLVKKKTKALVVLGGPHVSALPEESLTKEGVDLVVRGEGEETLLAIARQLSRGRSWQKIKGISYRKGSGFCHTPPRPLMGDLDRLPLPAYHLFKLGRYSVTQPLKDRQKSGARAFYLMTSRGCPFGCVYCFKGVFGRTWRPRSPHMVAAEWTYLVKKLKATEIGVQDDLFNLDRERAMAICDLLIKKKLNRVPWITNNGIRADKVDLELLTRMRTAGCKRVGFGVESGSPKILKRINKQLTRAQIENAFFLAKKAGLETMGFFMFGNPGETASTMEATIRFAIKLNPDIAHFSIATPFPGTPLYQEVLTYGKLLNNRWEDYGILEGKGFFNLGKVNPKLAQTKWHEAYRRFYLRPTRVLKEVIKKENWLNLKLLAGAAKRYFFK